MPVIVIDELDIGPRALREALPLRAELIRVLPGPDRPDYALAVLETPVTYHPALDDPRGGAASSPPRPIHAVAIVPRLVGTQLAPDMRDLWVGLAYVVDDSLARDNSLDLAKTRYVAVARINLDPAEHLPRYERS